MKEVTNNDTNVLDIKDYLAKKRNLEFHRNRTSLLQLIRMSKNQAVNSITSTTSPTIVQLESKEFMFKLLAKLSLADLMRVKNNNTANILVDEFLQILESE